MVAAGAGMVIAFVEIGSGTEGGVKYTGHGYREIETRFNNPFICEYTMSMAGRNMNIEQIGSGKGEKSETALILSCKSFIPSCTMQCSSLDTGLSSTPYEPRLTQFASQESNNLAVERSVRILLC